MKKPTMENEESGGEKSPTVINGNPPAAGGFNLAPGMKGTHWEIIPAGVTFKRGIDRDDWLKLAADGIGDFEHSRDNHTLCMLRVGDILAQGKLEFPEEYGQAIDATSKAIRLSTKTLQNVQWICGSVRPKIRRLMLSVDHHAAVAKLSEKDQDKFLGDALENEWSVADLKREIKLAFPNPSKKNPSKKKPVDLETEDGLFAAQEIIVEFFEKLTTAAEPGTEKAEAPHPEDWPKERKARWFPTVARLFAIFAAAEEPAREGAKVVAAYLDHPDNQPLASFTDKRKAAWKDPLNDLAKAGRRMAVIGGAKPHAKKKKQPAAA